MPAATDYGEGAKCDHSYDERVCESACTHCYGEGLSKEGPELSFARTPLLRN